jgi:hypothetical protein
MSASVQTLESPEQQMAAAPAAAISAAKTLGLDAAAINADKALSAAAFSRKYGKSLKESQAALNLMNSVTATAPGAPTIGAATIVNAGVVSVAFTPPGSDGGAPIDHYDVVSTPGGFTARGLNSPVKVTAAFVKTTGYTFKVTASNQIGASAASAASGSVTPNP